MKIGIIGAGNMAGALGTKWANAGHELLVAGRTPARAAEKARLIGRSARAGSLADAATFGDAVLVAVRREGVLETLSRVGDGVLIGKTLIDCTNPIAESEGFRLVTADARSMARRIADVTGAAVVKAFNLCHSSVYAMSPPEFDGMPLTVPFAGDGEAARTHARELIEAIGAAPLDVGGLERAGQLEAVGAIVIAVLVAGGDPRSMIAPPLLDGPEPGEQ